MPEGADGIWTVFIEEAPPRQSAAKPPLTIEATATSGGQRVSSKRQSRETTVAAEPFDDRLDDVEARGESG